MDADGVRALADVLPREILLARLAGALAAPMQQFASLLSALPRNFAYGLKALIDQGGTGVPEAPTAAEPPAEEPAAEAPAAEAPAAEAPAAEEPTDEGAPAAADGSAAETADVPEAAEPPTDSPSESVPPSPEVPAADATDTTQES
jgi:hypothetical protein